MSTVWETRYRVLQQQLEQLANELRSTPTPLALDERTVRLLTFSITLLDQHQVDRRGRCQLCKRPRWTGRFWHHRPHCTVGRALAFALRQGLEVVWWQLLMSTGKKCGLADVREWMAQREQQASPSTPP